MTTMQAIKAFFNEPPVTNQELIALKKGCKKEEYDQFGKDVCKELGEEWEEAK